MAIEHIKETDTLNQGRQKINEIMDQSNQSVQKIDDYSRTLEQGIKDAKQIAADAGDDAKQIAQNAGAEANQKADQAVADSKTAVETANRAVGTANQNKQEFDTLRNEFDELVAESGDSNPEIVQARTDTEGIKQPTLQARLARDFGNRLTTADAIQLFSGSVNTPKMMDFSGKTAGNLATNPHQGYSDYTAATLKKPAAAWNEVNQDDYNKLVARDDSGVSTGSTQNGVIPQQLYKFDVIKAIEQIAPTVFIGKSLEESIQLVKTNFVSFTLALRGKATSPNNKNLKVATYLESTDSYSTQLQSATQEYSDFTTEINDRNFIDSKGKINVLVYSDSSNGVTSSNIDIDYVGVQIVVSLNPLDVLESSGFAKSEDVTNQLKQHTDDKNNPHSVTKSQVGLGSVPNYGAATDAEALLGTVNNKVMTPKNVKDVLDAKTVLIEGNQEISGIKSFNATPKVKDSLILTENDFSVTVLQGIRMKGNIETGTKIKFNDNVLSANSLKSNPKFSVKNETDIISHSSGIYLLQLSAFVQMDLTSSNYFYIDLFINGAVPKDTDERLAGIGGQHTMRNEISGATIVKINENDVISIKTNTNLKGSATSFGAMVFKIQQVF